MKTFLLAGLVAALPLEALAQTPAAPSRASAPAAATGVGDAGLGTRPGHELNVSFGHYTYTEPGALSISIHGPKFVGGYTGTFALSPRRHLFAQADVRASVGNTTYDGFCSPFFIAPNTASPNGYELDIGDASPCSESPDVDWYVEARGLVGKDLVRTSWGFSPFTGLGLRHLSNGLTGAAGYRTDNYLYLPVGLTTRTRLAQRILSATLEYDQLLHGWQTTRDSLLGTGVVPATATAPAFTIESFSDISFSQTGGWAVRVSGKYQITDRWSVEPSFIRWHVSASNVQPETVVFTVGGISAQEQLSAYEPLNITHEFVVKVGFHF